ncbi:MAG: glucokinase [Marinovum sp.]|nr:glucokinase [Marinovum sp.]
MTSQTLVIDIGGTNTRVALAQDTQINRETVRRYRNAEVAGLSVVIADYLSQANVQVQAACVAGAGPVRESVLRLTNLDWVVDPALLTEATGTKDVAILNDLQAQGHALDTLPSDAVKTLLPGAPHSSQAAKLVVNVGTGMNIAPVYRLNGQTVVPASEAGHALLPAQTDDEIELLPFLTKRHGFAAVEEALSGRGLEALYAFVSDQEAKAADIMARLDTDRQAQAAVTLFVGIFGRVTGNLTLIHLPFGGVYLVGGVVQHMANLLMDYGFGPAFRDKGRFSDFMDQFGVHIVQDDYAALIGCAAHMAELRGAQ